MITIFNNYTFKVKSSNDIKPPNTYNNWYCKLPVTSDDYIDMPAINILPYFLNLVRDMVNQDINLDIDYSSDLWSYLSKELTKSDH